MERKSKKNRKRGKIYEMNRKINKSLNSLRKSEKKTWLDKSRERERTV